MEVILSVSGGFGAIGVATVGTEQQQQAAAAAAAVNSLLGEADSLQRQLLDLNVMGDGGL